MLVEGIEERQTQMLRQLYEDNVDFMLDGFVLIQRRPPHKVEEARVKRVAHRQEAQHLVRTLDHLLQQHSEHPPGRKTRAHRSEHSTT